MPIFLLLVAVPIIEIALFIEVGGWLGLWPTLAVVVLTAAIGAVLLRAQGLATLGELQRRLGAGEDPSSTLAHGAMILIAGILLLTPGFFTDGVGFLLLTPPVRAAAIRFARSRLTQVHVGVHMGAGVHRGPAGPGTVDGEYEVVDPDGGAT
ncbi:MAG: FxsA family protein, partial [Paracoccaceae bacterium]